MPNGKKKIKKIAEFALDTAMPLGHIVNPAIRKAGKEVGGRVACQKKGGKWVKGKCVSKAKPQPPVSGPKDRSVRAGRKKYSSPPKRSSY